MSGCSGALKPVSLGLSCKANKYSDARIGNLGMPHTHESPPMQLTNEDVSVFKKLV